MMNFTGSEVAKEYERAFGKPISEITEDEMWWLIKLSKHIRGRCRSNKALMNFLNLNFSQFEFRLVERKGQDGQSYRATVILPRQNVGTDSSRLVNHSGVA